VWRALGTTFPPRIGAERFVIVATMPRLWDASLYKGSAEYYLAGRLPYPERVGLLLAERLGLDGQGRLLDLGCGPGALTLLLAPWFGDVVAIDADADMVHLGEAEAVRRGVQHVAWLQAYAEDVNGIGQFRVVTLAQSFHWMDQPLVAAKIRLWLTEGGYCVHVDATTHEGTGSAAGLPHPAPPRERITELIRAYLGPQRRAGQQVVVGGSTPDNEEAVFRAAGFAAPEVLPVPGGDVFERSEDQVVAAVLSLSSAAPHLFGDRLTDFVDDLKQLLRAASPARLFSEQLQDMRLFLWRA